MILLFGGTTEGRQAAALLDRLAMPFIYSTNSRVEPFATTHGEFRHGALDEPAMEAFVRFRVIRLVIDAAHPFASRLHRAVFDLCTRHAISLIRFERAASPLPSAPWLYPVADFAEALVLLERLVPAKLLALTGVHSVAPLHPWWSRHKMLLRILPSPASILQARSEGIPETCLLPMSPDGSEESLEALVRSHAIDCLLVKESGESGFFSSKLHVAERCGTTLIVIRRPPTPSWDTVAFTIEELESLLPSPSLKPLRCGYTTGACAAAATKAALITLLDGKVGTFFNSSSSGNEVTLDIVSPTMLPGSARCGVRKDAGDDPDVTHGLVICSEVSLLPDGAAGEVRFLQGEGVGRVTLPGLEIPPGEPAINPVPRRMIRDAVREVLTERGLSHAVAVTISVPGGEAVARKTMNARLGIIGGISILGTTGIVTPYSIDAWITSIRYAIAVARATGSTTIALTSGHRSERLLRNLHPELVDQECIHYGNAIGRSLELIREQGGFTRVIVAVMLAKATKLAQGEADLSSRVVSLNPRWLATLAVNLGYSPEIAGQLAELHLLRNMTDLIAFSSDEPLYNAIAEACHQNCRQWLPDLPLTFVLFDIDGRSVVAG